MFNHLPIHEKFFSLISNRLYKENNLSDLTWALCKTSRTFLNLFLKFFGFTVDETAKMQVIREFPEGLDRPDLTITQDRNKFVIEVKIDDQNYHMEQYAKTFKDAKLGLIARHDVKARCGFETRTWAGFYDYVRKQYSEEIFREEESLLVSGYLAYLKEVCGIMDLDAMRFEGLFSLACFNKIIREIIDRTEIRGFTIYCDNKKPSISYDYSGIYFLCKNKKGGETAFPWFGISYENNINSIIIEVDDYHTNEKIFSELKKNLSKEGGCNFEIPYLHEEDEYESVVYKMKDDVEKKFFSECIDNQRRILTDFYIEVVGVIGRGIGKD
jgi:hypothetical protein